MHLKQSKYLVRFADRYFFVGLDENGSPTGTLYPSYARTMSYMVAVEVAIRLQDIKYTDAVVATQYGKPALPEDTRALVKNLGESDEFKSAWNSAMDLATLK